MLSVAAIGLALLFQIASPLMADALPSSVQFKVDHCMESLNDAEAELDARNPHMAREPLRVAKDRLDSIKANQSTFYDHPDVVAARNRYDAVEKRYKEAQEKQEASAGLAEEQLKKLEGFRQFSPDATYPEHLVEIQSTYLAAKALINEIAEAGTDVQLQGYSDYKGTKLSVEVYESNLDRVVESFIETAKEYTAKNTTRMRSWLDLADKRLLDIEKLLPAGDPRIEQAQTSVREMHAFIRQEQLENAAKVFMRPDKYKGKDADAYRALAKKAVINKFPKAKILKINLVSSAWGAPEGGAQWTDNTRSAVEVRTTSYFSAEVAAKEGEEVMLHRVYLYKEKVNGKLQPAKSYIVGSQMMLEKNVK